jgi:ketopantoate reductase
MDRMTEYKQFVREILTEIYDEMPKEEGVRAELTFDDERGHYYIVEAGWSGKHRILGIVVHCTVLDGKIYVEHDGVSIGIVAMLMERGVPPTNLVLGFHPPNLRHYTQFALS